MGYGAETATVGYNVLTTPTADQEVYVVTQINFVEPEVPERDPWRRLEQICAEHGKRKVENHTYLQRDTDETGDHIVYSLVLHKAVVVVFDPRERTITLDATNVRTPLTLRRLNTWLLAFGLAVEDEAGLWVVRRWYSGLRVLFTDGMVVRP